MANAPLAGRDGGSSRPDLGLARSELFFRTRLDRANQLEMIEKLSACAQRRNPSESSPVSRRALRQEAPAHHLHNGAASMLDGCACPCVDRIDSSKNASRH
jgi:hypothetical protein